MALTTVSRSAWGAAPAPAVTPVPDHLDTVVLHHTATQPGPDVPQILRTIQRVHQKLRGFADIGYNFLIAEDGTAYEGRGWGVQGAHTVGHNGTSVGIALIGTYTARPPTPAQVETFGALVAEGVRLGHLSPRPMIRGHRELDSTACPGAQTDILTFAIAAARVQEAPVPADPNPNVEMPTGVTPVSLSPVVLPDGRQGYHVLASDGSVYSFGAAAYVGRVRLHGTPA